MNDFCNELWDFLLRLQRSTSLGHRRNRRKKSRFQRLELIIAEAISVDLGLPVHRERESIGTTRQLCAR